MYPFNQEDQKRFPDFDYRNPSPEMRALCDMRRPDNVVGYQQRAVTCYWAVQKCAANDLGLDLGSPRGLTPYCMHVDVFGDGRVHPFYGGGRYLADVVADAGDPAALSRIFPADAFPYIASNHSLEHMPAAGDDGIVILLRAWMKLLRKDGILAMVVPDNDHWDVMASDKDHKHAWGASNFRQRVLNKLLEHDSSWIELVEFDTLKNYFSFDVILKRR